MITHPDGTPITRPSKFCRLCRDIIRKTEQGRINCIRSDSIIGRQNADGPTVQACLSGGLWDAGASITVGGKHIANWLVGQVKNEGIDEEKVIGYAGEIGADPEACREALREVPVMSLERFHSIARLVFLLSNELSLKAFQNLQQARLFAQHKRAEDAVRRSEAELRSFVEKSPFGIYRSGIEADRLLSANPALVKMLGYDSEEDLLSIKLSTGIYLVSQSREETLKLILQDGGFNGIEAQWKRKDGKIIVARISGRLAQESVEGGRVLEGIVEDVTEYRALQNQLLQAQKMEAVGQLAGGVAHDFNNSLMIIRGYTEIMQEQMSRDSSLYEQTQQVLKATDRAAGLTHRLLAFSRKQVLSPEIVDLNDVVQDTIKMVHRLIGEDITLSFTPDRSLWPVKADPAQIVQILLNLCINGRDAMPIGGNLTIETYNVVIGTEPSFRQQALNPGSYVVLALSDTGVGMTEEVQQHIFEPFYTTKEKGKGTGLGLSTVYGIVKQSGGYITVSSEVGCGTTFKVYLPRTDQPLTGPASVEVTDLSGCGETVLVTEDEESLRKAITQYLSKHGYTVLEAGNGAEAMEMANREASNIHLLLTDIIMPGMNGRDLDHLLRAKRPWLQTVFMSGYTDDTVFKHGMLEPGLTFLQKPFTLTALGRKIREVLARPVRDNAARARRHAAVSE